jgi:hypothetical protein
MEAPAAFRMFFFAAMFCFIVTMSPPPVVDELMQRLDR